VQKTSSTIRRILGFSLHVLEQSSPLSLADLLNGDLLASYSSFSLDVRCVPTCFEPLKRLPECCPCRQNKPASVATDVQEALRIQQYLLGKASNADEKADITALQARAQLHTWQAAPPLTACSAAGEHTAAVQPAARVASAQAQHRGATPGGRVRRPG